MSVYSQFGADLLEDLVKSVGIAVFINHKADPVRYAVAHLSY
jgi:hypothetical protein